MLQFKHASNLSQLSPVNPSHPLVSELVRSLITEWPNHDPEADAFLDHSTSSLGGR